MCELELTLPRHRRLVRSAACSQFYDLIEIFRIGGYCPNTNYLFLGTHPRSLRERSAFWHERSPAQGRGRGLGCTGS